MRFYTDEQKKEEIEASRFEARNYVIFHERFNRMSPSEIGDHSAVEFLAVMEALHLDFEEVLSLLNQNIDHFFPKPEGDLQ
ncbi:hypothetical protein [Siccirubricoccus phaeus]|uniref:hypothetical protein n=1 Tax=Siccirubricoccus phaeus TaxID=2595053 RepID=UPI0011F0CAC5|nr:hypothetical protein [Siccirubricoccus phaeus]